MSSSDVLLNGKKLGWSSISCTSGVIGKTVSDIKGFSAVNYKVVVERGEARGHGRYNLGYTDGMVSYEGGVTMLREEADTFITKVLGNMDAAFVFNISYKKFGGARVYTMTLSCAGVNEYGGDDSQGPDALTSEIPFAVLEIRRDGKLLTADDKGDPFGDVVSALAI